MIKGSETPFKPKVKGPVIERAEVLVVRKPRKAMIDRKLETHSKEDICIITFPPDSPLCLLFGKGLKMRKALEKINS